MNIPKLTKKEIESIFGIKFNQDYSLTETENYLQQTEQQKDHGYPYLQYRYRVSGTNYLDRFRRLQTGLMQSQ